MENANNLNKIFIGGLHLQTTDESLKNFYEKWGDIVDCVVMRDSFTKKSRGFGFVTYAEAHMVDKCLAEKPHVVDGKEVDSKRAMSKEDSKQPEIHQTVTKVFVGGLKEPLDENDMKEYFSQFGNIEFVEMKTDKATGKKRGFCFLTFDNPDSVDKLVLMKYHTIKNVKVEVKKATDKNSQSSDVRGKRKRDQMDTGRGNYGSKRGAYGGGNRGGNFNNGYGGNDNTNWKHHGSGGYNPNMTGSYQQNAPSAYHQHTPSGYQQNALGAYNQSGYGSWNQGGHVGYGEFNQNNPNAWNQNGFSEWTQNGAYGSSNSYGTSYQEGNGVGALKNARPSYKAAGPYGEKNANGATKASGYAQKPGAPYGNAAYGNFNVSSTDGFAPRGN